MRARSWRLGALLLTLATIVVGCRQDKPAPPVLTEIAPTRVATAPQPAHEPVPDEFVWSGVDPQTLDPSRIHDLSAWWVSVNLFEGLLVPPPGDGPPQPGVAKEPPHVSEDGLVWTFRLREDARWSDGRPVTAHDFVYAWQRSVDPATASPNAEDFRHIVGAVAITEGKQRDLTTLGVVAEDDHTLTVRLTAPIPYFANQVAAPAYFPVRKDVVDAHAARWTLPENIIGNGAFVLKEWRPRDRIVLEKNERYWDAANVKLRRAVMLHSETEDSTLRWYETGKIHWVNTIAPDKVVAMRSHGRKDLHHGPMLCHIGAMFRLDRPPFDDVRVRRAFSMAVDRDRLVKHVLQRGDTPATHFIPSIFAELADYRSPEGLGYDPEAAARLLSEAGYPGGVGLPKIVYLFNTYEMNKTIGELIQRNLQEALGVTIELENLEWKTFLARIGQGDFQMARASWCGLPDPSLWLETFRSGAGSNYGGFSKPEYDALLDRIAQEPDRAKRNTLIAEGERMLSETQLVIPLYFPERYYLLKPFVQGFEPQSMDVHLLKYVRLERAS